MSRTKRHYEDALDEDTAEIEEGIRVVLFNHFDDYTYDKLLNEIQEFVSDGHIKLNIPIEDTLWDVAHDMVRRCEISMLHISPSDNDCFGRSYFMNFKQRWRVFSDNYEWNKRMQSVSSSSSNTPVAASK